MSARREAFDKFKTANLFISNNANPYLISPYSPQKIQIQAGGNVIYAEAIRSSRTGQPIEVLSTMNFNASAGANITIDNNIVYTNQIYSESLAIVVDGTALQPEIRTTFQGETQIQSVDNVTTFKNVTNNYQVNINGSLSVLSNIQIGSNGFITNSNGTIIIGPNFDISGAIFTGDIIPNSNYAYNLGSNGAVWKELWIGSNGVTNTIHIGPTATIGTDTSGDVVLSSNILTPGRIYFGQNAYIEQLTYNGNVAVYPGISNVDINNLIPASNNTYNIGSSNRYWKDEYLAGNLYLGYSNIYITNQNSNIYFSSNIYVSGLGYFGGDLIPTSNATYNIGSNTYQWNDIWLRSNLHLGNATSITGDDITSNLNITTGIYSQSDIIYRTGLITASIGIGYQAGSNNADGSVSIGYRSGFTGQSTNTIAIGYQNASVNQGSNGISLGTRAALSNQRDGSIAIGAFSGQTDQKVYSIGLGYGAGNANQGSNSIAIGVQAGAVSQSLGTNGNGIAIGNNAGYTLQNEFSIAIGYYSGNNTQGRNAIAIGRGAGQTSQTSNTISIGTYLSGVSGQQNQSEHAVSIGYEAGFANQASNAVAIGNGAGRTAQGIHSVAIGGGAGYANMAAGSIIVNSTGVTINKTSTGLYMNTQSGSTQINTSGTDFDISVGDSGIYMKSTPGSVVLNATASSLIPAIGTNGLFVKPMRSRNVLVASDYPIYYDSLTNEVFYKI